MSSTGKMVYFAESVFETARLAFRACLIEGNAKWAKLTLASTGGKRGGAAAWSYGW